MDYGKISKEELGKGSPIRLEILDTEDDIYHDMAREMIVEIKKNNSVGKNTVFIVPVGPVGQYRRFARTCNLEHIDCKNVYMFNMDEYLTDDQKLISYDNPLSFRSFMDRELYFRMDEDINIPKSNRFFPDPKNLDFTWDKIQELGGIDVAFGGIGINGHIAFNEPPEPGEVVDNEEFRNRKTRILKLSRETRTINSVTVAFGNIDEIPEWCITIGMKEILSARKIRFYLNRIWQGGIVRKVLHGPVTAHVPASFFQQHYNAKLIIASYVAECPRVQPR